MNNWKGKNLEYISHICIYKVVYAFFQTQYTRFSQNLIMAYLFWLPIIKMNWFLFFFSKDFHQMRLITPLNYIHFSWESGNSKPHCEHDLKDFCRKCMENNCRNVHLRDWWLAGCCHLIQLGDLTSIKLSGTYHKGKCKD